MGRIKPLRPIIPQPPGTQRAQELRQAEGDLFDALNTVSQALQLGLLRAATLSFAGVVTLILLEDEPQLCADCAPLEADKRLADCPLCQLAPKRPKVLRFSKMDHLSALEAAAEACYVQIQHLAALKPTPHPAAEAYLVRLKWIRSMRAGAPQIIVPDAPPLPMPLAPPTP